ncbi:phospholipase D-like domain-containing protein [Mucilaginibacter lutimaris]|uniref:Phospholipase D-like domain-containing protein n=1 Tax=Mucilaginibacter lutimaris TaxID=931629 RepID=A0ABW2ZED4_9SPHI
MLFKNGVQLRSELLNFLTNQEECHIYVPYIKLESLKPLIEAKENVKMVVVRWEPRDLIAGSSDLEVYPYLKERGITLYRNPRLHLKAFVANYERAFIGSANISQRALNYPENINYNYELALVDQQLDLSDRLYFNMIEAESILITDNIYDQIKLQLPEKIKTFPKEADFKFEVNFPDKGFSIASLPMTYSVETLHRIYQTQESIHKIELNCAMHDLAIYRIPLGLEMHAFEKELKSKFFNHPFIRSFLEYVDTEEQVFFGGAKDWIHRNCSDVPTPRKFEITENIQILYRWITKLSDGIYKADRPNHSERLYRVSS